jgi:hypothetical protein
MQLRLAISLLLITVALTTIPSGAYAQTIEPTTSIVALNYYPNAAVDSMTTVSFDATYSTNQKVWLVTAIGCEANESNCSSVLFDGVDSSPFPCNSVNPFGNSQPLILGTCYLTVSTGGVDFFSFNLSFSKAGTYNLTALVQLNSPGDSNNIPGSRSVSQTMTVKVT